MRLTNYSNNVGESVSQTISRQRIQALNSTYSKIPFVQTVHTLRYYLYKLRVHTLRFHLHKLQRQANLNHGTRNQNNGYPWGR